MYSKQHGREEDGVLISAKEHMRFIPHFTIDHIVDFNNKGRDFKHNQYHFGYRSLDMAITYCYECKGVGKFDWIQQTAPARALQWGEAPKHFTRDERFYYVHPNFSTYLFAKVKLEPGDSYCTFCRGFGIVLDARFKIFRGMIGLRTKLLEIEANNYVNSNERKLS